MKKIFSIILGVFISALAFGDQADIDSLKTALDGVKIDTVRIILLNKLASAYCPSDPQQGMKYASSALELSKRIHWIPGEARSIHCLGFVYASQSNFVTALEYYLQSLKIIASHPEIKNMSAMVYNNIGNIYKGMEDYPQALKNYEQAMQINKEFNNQSSLAYNYGNIGDVYYHEQDYKMAMEFYQKTFEIQNHNGINPIRICKVYMKQKQYDEAISFATLGIEICRENNDQRDLGIGLQLLANIYVSQVSEHSPIKELPNSHLEKAIGFAEEAETIFHELVSTYDLIETYQVFIRAYKIREDYKTVARYYDLLYAAKDTLFNETSSRQLATLQTKYETEQKDHQITILSKDKEIQQKEISKQKIIRNSFVGGFSVVLFFAGVILIQSNRIRRGKKRSDELLLNILPAETAEELKATGMAKARSYDEVSVMFTDFKNFTRIAEDLSVEDLISEINFCYSEFDKIIQKYKIEKIKTIGDSYMCAGGLPVANRTNALDMVNASLEIQEFMNSLKEARIKENKIFFEIRLGIHTGPVVAGIVGIKKFAYDIWGDTVNIASRIEASGEVGKVNVSSSTYQLIKDNFNCVHRGKIEAKNKGLIDMYFVSRNYV